MQYNLFWTLRKAYVSQYLAMRQSIFWFFRLQGIDWYWASTYLRGGRGIKNLGSNSTISPSPDLHKPQKVGLEFVALLELQYFCSTGESQFHKFHLNVETFLLNFILTSMKVFLLKSPNPRYFYFYRILFWSAEGEWRLEVARRKRITNRQCTVVSRSAKQRWWLCNDG